MTDSSVKEHERRSYFRIEDIVGLSYSIGLETTALHPANDISISTDVLLEEIDREFNQLVNAVWLENPTIAKCIGLLNRKVDLIYENVASDKPPQSNTEEHEQKVSLSASGMAFTTDTELAEQLHLTLRLKLKPSNINITVPAQVIKCSPKFQSNEFLVRVIFTSLPEMKREQLIQHIVQKQFNNKPI